MGTRRANPRSFTVGDEAIVEFGPGLLQFLTLNTGTGPELGNGGAFAWTIPVGAAGTAAYAALEPDNFAGVNMWTGVTNAVHWIRACGADETLIATCRISELGRYARLPYRTYSATRGDLLVSGEFVFASVANDAEGLYIIAPRLTPDAPVAPRAERIGNKISPMRRPAPDLPETLIPAPSVPDWSSFDLWSDPAPAFMLEPEPIARDLFVIRPPRVLRRYCHETGAENWDWLFPRDLLRLLGNPIGGAMEPLGRRHHPFGRILEGMAVHAAREMSNGGGPRALEVRWYAPTRGEEDFRIRSTMIARDEAGTVSTHDIYEGERMVGAVKVTTQGKDAPDVA